MSPSLKTRIASAIVPLSVSATPFFARIAEVSLREVDAGLIEAAQSIGCRRRHILAHVLLPEALPGLIGGMTVSVIAMVSTQCSSATLSMNV